MSQWDQGGINVGPEAFGRLVQRPHFHAETVRIDRRGGVIFEDGRRVEVVVDPLPTNPICPDGPFR